tara:strand:- start:16505 stop:17983 length:1479 start_codon:yes stop_codon:yes gene_type:complete
MSEFSSPLAEPSYIARLALQSAPFNAVIEPKIFFKGEQIEQRFNLLLHLIRASDKVGLLLAEQGLGKSTLLTQLQHNKTDDLRICRINGDASLTSMEIILQCLSAFGVDNNDVQFSNDHLILLKDRLSGLRQLNIKPLLLIDDVDLLSEEPLMVLMDCLSWLNNDVFLLHAVFTSKQVVPALSTIHGRLQQIDLPALSEHELGLYLEYRLEAVGYHGDSVFSPKDLTQCYRQSAGIPALINQWAHQRLLGMKATFTNPIKINVGQLMPILRWSGLGLLVISLILLLLFQDTINDLFSPKIVDEMNIEKPFTSQDESLAKVILGEDKITSAAQAERDELKSLVSELAVDVATPEEVPDTISQDKMVSQAPVQTIVTKPILKPEPALPKELSSTIHQKKWILQQSATDYTFQLMGSWDKQEVVAFLEKYALTGDVAEFESMRNGRVWYALIYGVYDNKQAALDASSSWPAPINTLPSWLRRFDSVQQQIKKTAN